MNRVYYSSLTAARDSHAPVLLVVSSTASTEYTITVTPCAANSLRVNVKLRQPSSATSALQRALDDTLRVEGLNELPGAFICPPTTAQTMELTSTLPTKTHGNLQAVLSTDGESISFTRVDTGAKYFEARPVLESLPRGDDTSLDGYLQAVLTLAAGDASERLYGLGQGEWNKPPGGCPSGPQHVVPQARNGQTINLLQTKFHIAVPTMVSSAGYAFVFNMPGYGNVSLGPHGTGGAKWNATAALSLDFWVSGLPEGAPHPMAPLYSVRGRDRPRAATAGGRDVPGGRATVTSRPISRSMSRAGTRSLTSRSACSSSTTRTWCTTATLCPTPAAIRPSRPSQRVCALP